MPVIERIVTGLGNRDPGHGRHVAVLVVLAVSAIASLGAGCAGVREWLSTEKIRVGGIDVPSRPETAISAVDNRALPLTSLLMGEVRDRRNRPEYLGQGAVSSWNPLLGTWVPTANGPNLVPLPTPDSRILKLQEGGALRTTFRADAAKILEGEGISAISTPPPAEKSPSLRLDLEILEATALSEGRLSTFLDKGTIVASFGFSAIIVEAKTGDVLWRGWFGRKETMEARYFSAKKYEKALNQVYRQALEDFAREASGGLLAKIVRDPNMNR